MKYLLVTLFVVSFFTDPFRIGKINRAKSEARKAFVEGNYKAAISQYQYLIDSMHVGEDELKLNLGHAYFQLNDTANAITTYSGLIGSKQNVIRSKAQLQLGILNYRKQKLEEALNNFKQALKADSDNDDARYNYELLKKKLDEKKKKEEEQKKDQNKDQNKDQKDQNEDQKDKQDKEKQEQKDKEQKEQEKKDQQKKEQEKKDQQKKDQEKKDQEKKDQQQDQKDKQKEEQEKKDKEKQRENSDQKDDKDKDKNQKPNPERDKKLEQMKISEEKAKMILDAMRSQEVQYLQQNKRKATKPRDRSKPDW